ncbi:M48 family metallopeptidase [Streptomyces sp. NBC_01387]|uniref:M48 family metallopeptidase n=1 Tax=unclassified Streptomyces TaxID=2593676 RepID=UPI00225417A9|nr:MULTISPECIES: M48 family metallopeptidase [unclassified Streptomyces]MCX4553934.1 M48 family metallopeptidase [Streptomyces sp. NBC_01500]WSC18842.1 M48 family metallopeptidase [Streptomyces sp. NBC_01766]
MTELDAATNADGTRQVRQDCPECGAAVVKNERFVTWCLACDWNADPGAPEPEPGRLDAARRKLARRHGEQLYTELSQGGELRPHRDLISVLAQVVALAVHAVTAALAVAGVLLVVLGWSTVVQPVCGLALILLAVGLRPRFMRFPEGGVPLHRTDAPALFGLIDRVAESVGTRGVDVVLVDASANAAVTAWGIRRRRLLFLGLCLWEPLAPQERIALLGHELGHYANGDIRHGAVIAPAFESLSFWYSALAPTSRPTLQQTLVDWALALPRWMVIGTALLLDHLTLRATQRGEYLADRKGARAGSSEAAVALMDRLSASSAVEDELRRLSVAARSRSRGRDARTVGPELWERVVDHTASVPEHERERLRRVSVRRGHSVNSTHPPTHLRRQLLAESEPCAAEVVADSATVEAVAAELAGARAVVARAVVRGLG